MRTPLRVGRLAGLLRAYSDLPQADRGFSGLRLAAMSSYRPFIDDPAHIALVEGERYVVLRPTAPIPDIYDRVQALFKEKLAGLPVSYPAQPHVTLAGLASGTPLESVRDLVAQWARTIPPLQIDVEKVSSFPTPSQIVIVQVRKTAELFGALSSLRAAARQRELGDLAVIAPTDWIFHMSVAYCSSLDASEWTKVMSFAETVKVPAAHCTVSEVEIAAFDEGREYSGGVIELSHGGP
jgi:2'-5' RNA ligase